MDDAELVEQAKQGQQSAYGELVQRWAARLIAFLRARVLHADVAEDIAQECFFRAYRRLDSLSDPKKFGSWLLTIGNNAILDWRKAKARSEVQLSTVDDSASMTIPAGEQPSDESIRGEQQQLLFAAIRELPLLQRETILIYYFDDVTYAELAEMLDISVATVNARLSKARDALRQKLGAKWCANEM